MVSYYNLSRCTVVHWLMIIGDIIQFSLPGRQIIVLNKAEDVHNLLNKRGSNYSDRAEGVLQGEL